MSRLNEFPDKPRPYVDSLSPGPVESEQALSTSLLNSRNSFDDDLPAYSNYNTEVAGSQPGLTSYDDSMAEHTPHTLGTSLRHTTISQLLSHTIDSIYSTDPEAMCRLIMREAGRPPRPTVSFIGQHDEDKPDGKKSKTETVTDFNVTLDCSEFFQQHDQLVNPDASWHILESIPDHVRTYRGGILIKRATGPAGTLDSEASVQEFDATTFKTWCYIFCARASHSIFPYTFTLKRKVTEWDTVMLETFLTSMIRRRGYTHNVHIRFCTENSTFTVYSNHWMNKARQNNWIWWVFVLLQLWILTWPILWLCTGRFEVINSIWPYKKTVRGRLTYAAYSEQEWINTWGQAMVNAAIDMRKGPLTAADLELLFRPPVGPSVGSSREYYGDVHSSFRFKDTVDALGMMNLTPRGKI